MFLHRLSAPVRLPAAWKGVFHEAKPSMRNICCLYAVQFRQTTLIRRGGCKAVHITHTHKHLHSGSRLELERHYTSPITLTPLPPNTLRNSTLSGVHPTAPFLRGSKREQTVVRPRVDSPTNRLHEEASRESPAPPNGQLVPSGISRSSPTLIRKIKDPIQRFQREGPGRAFGDSHCEFRPRT